ncbi:hypothetical protein OG788_42650 [Streptomyces sp. NBC_00647]|uniref:hypothetical protein n=1 Tax=Streptomyces sp. NBC_00647 TaxID=2975796 RepID=UPI00324AF353
MTQGQAVVIKAVHNDSDISGGEVTREQITVFCRSAQNTIRMILQYKRFGARRPDEHMNRHALPPQRRAGKTRSSDSISTNRIMRWSVADFAVRDDERAVREEVLEVLTGELFNLTDGLNSGLSHAFSPSLIEGIADATVAPDAGYNEP